MPAEELAWLEGVEMQLAEGEADRAERAAKRDPATNARIKAEADAATKAILDSLGMSEYLVRSQAGAAGAAMAGGVAGSGRVVDKETRMQAAWERAAARRAAILPGIEAKASQMAIEMELDEGE